MFYRRKILFSLIQLSNDSLEKLRLQKLLFLYSERKRKPEYEFVPYKFGCFSYSVNADVMAMVKRGWLTENNNTINKIEEKNYLTEIRKDDFSILKEIVETYGNMSNDSLIKHTYVNFPYYAINSTIAHKILDKKLYQRIESAIPKGKQKCLYTIGYEGISLEKYLNKLVKENIKLLIDVRKNPLSQKYGFSKSLLKRYCNNLNIEYMHIPDVGINSNKRQNLNSQEDYDLLFDDYKKTTLKETESKQIEILNLIDKYNRVALTCFESDKCQCHRLPLSNSIVSRSNKLKLVHL